MNRVRIGMLTPSSNTALEPITAAMLALLPDVSADFARFRVTEISLGEQALRQFHIAPLLEAARLLADARVDVIVGRTRFALVTPYLRELQEQGLTARP